MSMSELFKDGDSAELDRLTFALGRHFIGLLIEAATSAADPRPIAFEIEDGLTTVNVNTEWFAFRLDGGTPVSLPVDEVRLLLAKTTEQ